MRLLNHWATKPKLGVQPACTMTTPNSKIRLISSIALKSRLITYSYQPAIGKSHWSIQTGHSTSPNKDRSYKVNQFMPLSN